RRPICIAFHRYGGHRDLGAGGEALFKVVMLGLAFGQTNPPTIIVDDNADMIRVVEGECAALKRGIAEIPFWGCQLPNELCEISPVFVVACAATVGREIKLVPPFEFSFRRQRRLVGCGAANQITTDGDSGFATFRP